MIGIPAFLKVGKVVAINPESHALDIAYLDGGFANNVPTLSAAAGTTFGLSFLPVPTYEKDVPQRKTYPHPVNMTYDEETNPDKTGQDQYVLVAQLEGSLTGLGMSGAIVLGYFYPQVSEMLLDKGENGQFKNHLLFRHPSDLQVTIDKNANLDIQYPGGSRIAMGNTNKKILRKKDYDKRYQLRRNINVAASILVRAVNGGVEMATAGFNAIGELDLYGLFVARIQNFIASVKILASGDIRISTKEGRGPDPEPTEGGESFDIPHAPDGRDIILEAKRDIQGQADRNIELIANANITETAGGIMQLTATIINLN